MTTPTKPGVYEYRWTCFPDKDYRKWTRVEIKRGGKGLLVVDPGVQSPSRLETYINAEWREAE